mmetsp:Transcript_158808/g.505646  ORF Transcript_158808/g.505646 Transcript_158808/m.505646 type:complete len:116 (-) Transcript_158808:373-720(-)
MDFFTEFTKIICCADRKWQSTSKGKSEQKVVSLHGPDENDKMSKEYTDDSAGSPCSVREPAPEPTPTAKDDPEPDTEDMEAPTLLVQLNVLAPTNAKILHPMLTQSPKRAASVKA